MKDSLAPDSLDQIAERRSGGQFRSSPFAGPRSFRVAWKVEIYVSFLLLPYISCFFTSLDLLFILLFFSPLDATRKRFLRVGLRQGLILRVSNMT